MAKLKIPLVGIEEDEQADQPDARSDAPDNVVVEEHELLADEGRENRSKKREDPIMHPTGASDLEMVVQRGEKTTSEESPRSYPLGTSSPLRLDTFSGDPFPQQESVLEMIQHRSDDATEAAMPSIDSISQRGMSSASVLGTEVSPMSPAGGSHGKKRKHCAQKNSEGSSKDRSKKSKKTSRSLEASPTPDLGVAGSSEKAEAIRTVEFLKAPIDFTRPECLAFLQSLCGVEEKTHFANLTPAGQMTHISTSLVKSGLRVGDAAVKLEAFEAEAAADKARVMTLRKELNSALEQVEDLKTQLALKQKAYDEEKQKRKATEESLEKEKADLGRYKQEFWTHVRDKVAALLKRKKQMYQERGVADFRANFLKTAEGQELLRILHEDFLADYGKTSEFVGATTEGLGFLIGEAIRVTLHQIDATPAQKKMLNADLFKEQMDLPGLGKAMGEDLTMPEDWWISTMDRAAKLLVEGDNTLPPVTLYSLPYLTTRDESSQVGPDPPTSEDAPALSEDIEKELDQLCEDDVASASPAAHDETALDVV